MKNLFECHVRIKHWNILIDCYIFLQQKNKEHNKEVGRDENKEMQFGVELLHNYTNYDTQYYIS